MRDRNVDRCRQRRTTTTKPMVVGKTITCLCVCRFVCDLSTNITADVMLTFSLANVYGKLDENWLVFRPFCFANISHRSIFEFSGEKIYRFNLCRLSSTPDECIDQQ